MDSLLRHDPYRDLNFALDRALDRAFTLDSDIALVFARNLDIACARNFARDFAHDFDLALNLAFDLELGYELQQLKQQLPDISDETWENFYQWWCANGKAWAEQFRVVMIEHHNRQFDSDQRQLLTIEHYKLQFNDNQRQLLQQYYPAFLTKNKKSIYMT